MQMQNANAKNPCKQYRRATGGSIEDMHVPACLAPIHAPSD